MPARTLVSPRFPRTCSGIPHARKMSSGKAPLVISTTEVLCARMSSWMSALACYEFFRKRHLPISDEAVMSLYLRLRDVADGCGVNISPPNYQKLQSSHGPTNGLNRLSATPGAVSATRLDRGSGDGCPSKMQPNPLTFLIHSTQHQSTLRPLYHRLRFLLQETKCSSQEESTLEEPGGRVHNAAQQTVLLDALPLLSTPCAIINISLRHNLRRRRWADVLRTIRNLYRYDLMEPYLQELFKVCTRDDTGALLAAVSHDTCYRGCVEAPSLVPVMDELLVQWEEYWSMLKQTGVEGQGVWTGIPFPASSSSYPLGVSASVATEEGGKKVGEATCVGSKEPDSEIEVPDVTQPTPLAVRLDLEVKSLDVILLAGRLAAFMRRTRGTRASDNSDNDGDDKRQMEEDEVYHRLVEATTHIAEFTLCRRLATEWSIIFEKNRSGTELHPLPPRATKELLLTRLLLRAPSCEVALQILDEWDHSLSAGIRHSDDALPPQYSVKTPLHCPEVISALATRLPPEVFLREILESRLQEGNIVLDWRMRELVRAALHRGGLYDAAERFCISQAHLELAMLSKVEERNLPRSSFALLLKKCLSQRLATPEKARFVSGLLRHMGEANYTNVVEALLYALDGDPGSNRATDAHNNSFLLLWVIRMWITEDCCPGDAAVLLRHVIHAPSMRESTSSGNCSTKSRKDTALHSQLTAQHVITSLSEAVAYLGLVVEGEAPCNYIKAETVLQWLKLLSEIPPIDFEESVLVVWLFWTMRALVQWEEQLYCPTDNAADAEAVSKGVLTAIQNLSRSLENCEATAVLPPMLLNWLASRTGMTWADATAWIARNAGVETSQRRPFAFIRLPFGSSAFETVIDPWSRRRVLLIIEGELRRHYRPGHDCRSSSQGRVHLGEAVQELFGVIRFTLLRTWYCHALNVDASMAEQLSSHLTSSSSLDTHVTTASAITTTSALPKTFPYVGTVSMEYRRRIRSDLVIHSLHETLRCLWESRATTEHNLDIPPSHSIHS